MGEKTTEEMNEEKTKKTVTSGSSGVLDPTYGDRRRREDEEDKCREGRKEEDDEYFEKLKKKYN